MKYLVNVFNFSVRNWMLIFPLYVLKVLAALIGSPGSALSLGAISSMLTSGGLGNPERLMKLVLGIITAVAAGGGIVSFLVQFAIYPISYGLVNKSFETGNANLTDTGEALKDNFVRYLMYFVGQTVVFGIFFLVSFLLLLLFGLIASVLGPIGIALVFLAVIVLFIAGLVLNTFLCLWFSGMVIDSLDLVAAAKKSVEIVKSSFWTVLGIYLLVAIAASIIGAIFSFINIIPLLGPVIFSIIPAAQTFILIVFYISFYRDITGRTVIA